MEPTQQKPTNPKPDHKEQHQEFWSEHRTTLISYETQYVHNTRPQSQKEQEREEEDLKRPKRKKKNIEYEGGFLFPGRSGDKEESIPQLIASSKYGNLKQLFDQKANTPREILKLKQFVKIMLELKHNTILNEFLQIYDFIIKEIKEVKFDSIRLEKDRFQIVDEVSSKVCGLVQNRSYLFNCLNKYLKEHRRDTNHFFKVTIYCFLAEKYNFNINEYYSEAFDYQEEDAKAGKKKKKLQEIHQ